MLPPITYLTTDSLGEGVGASQVLLYAERLARRGITVRLHTFEKQEPAPARKRAVTDAGVDWRPHPFGRYGAAGGLMRVLSGARAVRGASIVHARSDLAAASAMLARAPHWVWDVRSLWPDQRVALGALRPGSPEERVLRRVEAAAATRSDHVVTLAHAVIPVLEERYGPAVPRKATVITTCVDLSRFTVESLPAPEPVRFLLAGTINAYYDVPTMLRLVELTRIRRAAGLQLVTPGPTAWDNHFSRAGITARTAVFDDMPSIVAEAHVGLSVCRRDAGVSLAATMPTKIGEFLAAGRPVVVNDNLGDAGALLREHRAGVALTGVSDTELTAALDELDDLLADPDTARRCRCLAEEHFDLEKGVDQLISIYQRLVTS